MLQSCVLVHPLCSQTLQYRGRYSGEYGGEASESYRDDPLVKPHDWPDVPDENEYLTLPDEVPEEMLE